MGRAVTAAGKTAATHTTAAKAAARAATGEYPWWASLNHGGLLIAPTRLTEFFPEQLPPLTRYSEDELRRAVTRLAESDGDARTALLDTVLEQVLGLGRNSSGRWEKGSAVGPEWSESSITGETIKPRRVWHGPAGFRLPVFVDPSVRRIGVGRGRRSHTRVVEWLRKRNEHLALLTNGEQWRLVYASLDTDAFAEWDTDLWFEEGGAGDQVEALRILLSSESLTPPEDGVDPPLLAAVRATRKGQAELSASLGERVRRAVELLIQENRTNLDDLDESIENRDVYIAATRVIMRMVVVLFAEARDLLPRDNPLYHSSYGLQGLRESLERAGGGASEERLRHNFTAWPRILGLFGLIYSGSSHPQLPVTRYGGGLFRPGDLQAKDPVLRALTAFESTAFGPSDAAVRRILDLLTRSRTRVRRGRGATYVEAPVDFSDLSSEYIGILYEGLLDFELRRADEGDPMIFLNLGDQPALPLSRLEEMDDKALKRLVEKFKQSASTAASEGVEEEEADAEAEAEAGEAPEDEELQDEDEEGGDESAEEADEEGETDLYHQARERAQKWACRAVVAGKLVKKGKKKPAEHQAEIDDTARRLVGRMVLPGERFLVRWGGTRKGAGTFYTRPQLAVPTVQRTLRPLAYDPPRNADGTPHEEAPPAAWTPKPPEEILDLTVCDPAMGSASFLVGALRFLTDALAQSLHYHGRLQTEADETLVTLAEGKKEEGFLAEDRLPARPEAEEFDALLRARLKRYVVERSLYGVDIDPLAVELARLSLWVETMDRTLPFGFLDHKLKIGNSLVGCWFDRFRDYPALAWERDGGDKNHTRGVHHEKEAWTKALKEFRNKRAKPELREWITEEVQGQQSFFPSISNAEALHDEAAADLRRLHELPVQETDERAEIYRREIVDNDSYRRLKQAFDIWCAAWFWPADRLDCAPSPRTFADPPPDTVALAESLAEEHRFFHWELEFPDVFDSSGSGFAAVVGNPPWENLQANPAEYFSNIDPLFRTYGRLESQEFMQEYFRADADVERDWLLYASRFRCYGNWVKNAARPFGDPEQSGPNFPLGSGGKSLHANWAAARATRIGYSDPDHPFLHIGGGRVFTYQLFLDAAHSLLRDGGQLGAIVPSGLYTDYGSIDLRALFLNRCRWRWLFGFENREKIFDIDSRFKFAPVIVEKGGRTDAVWTAFMRRSLADWEQAETIAIPYERTKVDQFSPRTHAMLELSEKRDLEILEKIYANSVLLGDDGPDGWGLEYRLEFMMNTDAHLFPPRPKWEEAGYRPDEYGRWLKGGWREGRPEGRRVDMEPGVILSVDGDAHIRSEDIEDVALPLYQGVMINQFDPAAAAYEGGAGSTVKWRPLDWDEKRVVPQFLIAERDYVSNPKAVRGLKVVFRDIARTTDARTMISTVLPDYPCGNVLGVLGSDKDEARLLPACLNSFVFDWVTRLKMGGTHLNYHVIADLPLVPPIQLCGDPEVVRITSQLSFVLPAFQKLLQQNPNMPADTSRGGMAPQEKRGRRALRAELGARIAKLYGLEHGDLRWILRDCDLPPGSSKQQLDPKGFWRVDKDRPPEERLTVMTLASLQESTQS